MRSALVALALIGGATAVAANVEDAFLEENDAAMTKMIVEMVAEPTGDVDADFIAMMIPHHQGAIEMARAQLRYGANEHVRRIALEIIARQEKEIEVLRRTARRQLAEPCTSDATVSARDSDSSPRK